MEKADSWNIKEKRLFEDIHEVINSELKP